MQSCAGAHATSGLASGSKLGMSKPGISRLALRSSPAYSCVKETGPPSVPAHAAPPPCALVDTLKVEPSSRVTTSAASSMREPKEPTHFV